MEMVSVRRKLKDEGKKVVFTNGCFDILHAGHVDYLSKAKALGDILIVGMNSDSSIRNIKGELRPIISEAERAFLVANLKAVDYVTLFDENTPGELIHELIPDILVKGADWSVENIVGRDTVEENGGEVRTIKFVSQQSTSKIINTILERYSK
ncbi:MAG: D-glycero-beta-D-manno-heptose 1-phosphate adenylyltransferase [Bacteroidota bacterium]|jgi:D-beta-D-heptose 7-phosphate kinase/D-beta-D-heptose 1-phosphate adenosyltransferase|nr:D-glycero-beta-D-manno-heptose 1-phosphate adenylyltransferase [Ignavibacteria bacterium]MCU7500216.1 D-glycero-beta-D-manno-heptose 1-phosphate adenylyltransferase [Ignavibacteria bacterium]MCU7511589.1 D-glycero-beta-D-manno-heptose 1-phosphate adenylyltransferase [Ignavibacteria bacterium]MCU7522078.1 D-glycero-beta-D-manno-heptose 1-phosphate adenylyltransferase [Ignavibacteria bacterium]MCU7525227.1 D-glycero-beta-D-manno-heptose 1-phosphate adenylyltransferase [Ignavibacteria bacterium